MELPEIILTVLSAFVAVVFGYWIITAKRRG